MQISMGTLAILITVLLLVPFVALFTLKRMSMSAGDKALQSWSDENEELRKKFVQGIQDVDEGSIFAEGVLRLDLPLDFDKDALIQRIRVISAQRPWKDRFGRREEINIRIETHVSSGAEGSQHPESLYYDPSYVQITFSHGCYHLLNETQLKAYRELVTFVANELRFTFPGLMRVTAFLETQEKVAHL